MHPGILGARTQIAHERIKSAVETLIKKTGIDPDLLSRLDIRDKDKAVQAMKESEVIADILEAITALTAVHEEPAAQEVPATPESLTAQEEVLAMLEVTETEPEEETPETSEEPAIQMEPAAQEVLAELPPVIEKHRRGKGK